MDGVSYKLDKNNGENSLHGGLKALDKKIWRAEIDPDEENTIHLACLSTDGDSGYPGKLALCLE